MVVFLNGSLSPKSSSLEDRRSRLLADRAPRVALAKNCSLYQRTVSEFKSISFTGIGFKSARFRTYLRCSLFTLVRAKVRSNNARSKGEYGKSLIYRFWKNIFGTVGHFIFWIYLDKVF